MRQQTKTDLPDQDGSLHGFRSLRGNQMSRARSCSNTAEAPAVQLDISINKLKIIDTKLGAAEYLMHADAADIKSCRLQWWWREVNHTCKRLPT